MNVLGEGFQHERCHTAFAKGKRCAERGGSAILLWQQELYHVLEREELSKRKHAPPKPYLYQALPEI